MKTKFEIAAWGVGAVLALSGCTSAGDDDVSTVLEAPLETVESAEDSSTTDATAGPAARPAVADDEPSVGDAEAGGGGESGESSAGVVAPLFDPDAPTLTSQFALVGEGTHRVDSLGTPFSFVATERLFVQHNGAGWVVLTDPASRGPDDRDIVMMRLSALSDPVTPTVDWATFSDGWNPQDFVGWLDNLAPGVVITNRTEASLGGLAATRVDVQLGEIQCDSRRACVYFGTNHLEGFKGLVSGSFYRIWVVDQAGEAPLAVIAGINSEAQRDWFERAEQILATVAFGEVAPNPLSVTPVGRAELPLLGGVRVDVRREMVVLEDTRGFYKAFSDLEPVIATYLVNPRNSIGARIESADDLVAHFIRHQAELSEIESTSVDGVEARVFDILGGSAELKFRADAEIGWRSSDQFRLWVMEHPERGLLVATAERFGRAGEGAYPALVAEVEAMLASAQFVEVG